MSRAAHRVLKADPVMASLIELAPPFSVELRADQSPFEALARAIAHQQLHGAAARRILERLVALGGGPEFPTPQQLLAYSDKQLRGVGFSGAKSAALRDLATKTIEGVVPDRAALAAIEDEDIIERLSSVRGIGRWTVEMLLIFHLRRPDVLPVDDFGVRTGFRLAYRLSGMPTTRALRSFGERWKPHRSMAAWYLWRAVELARDKKLPPHRHRTRIDLQPPPKKRAKTSNKASVKAKPAVTAKRRSVRKPTLTSRSRY